MLKIKPLYLIAIVLVTAFTTWKLTLLGRYPSAYVTLFTVKRLDSSLTAANEIMLRSNKQVMELFDQNLKRPETVDKASIWSPKMHAANAYTEKMALEIEALKMRLKKEASLEVFDGQERYHEDDIDAVTRLMINQGEGKKLMDSLQAFEMQLLSLLPKEKREKVTQIPITNLMGKTAEEYFKASPAIAGVALLTKFQNDVLRSGNIVLDFFSFQIGISCDFGAERIEPLVSQNTTHLIAGETLEIIAGLGAFTTVNKPDIIINGKPSAVDENGVATYKIKVTGTGGKIPVSISFIDPNTGQIVTWSKEISYIVRNQ